MREGGSFVLGSMYSSETYDLGVNINHSVILLMQSEFFQAFCDDLRCQNIIVCFLCHIKPYSYYSIEEFRRVNERVRLMPFKVQEIIGINT